MKEKEFIDLDYIKRACEEKGIDFEESLSAIRENKIPSYMVHDDGHREKVHIVDIDDNGDCVATFLD